jgi:hypothetical protein
LAKFDHAFIWLFATVFVAIELVVLFNATTLGDLAVEADYLAEIAPAARNLAGGVFRIEDYPFKGPASAMTVALLNGVTAFVGLGLFRTGILLSLIAAVTTLWCVYRVGLGVWGRRTAIAAVVLTGLNNVFFINAHKAGSDVLFLALVMAVLHMSLANTAGRRRCILIGVTGGAAFLTRYIGIVLPLWLIMSIFLLRLRGTDWRSRLAAAGWFGLGFVGVVFPWLAFSLAETGSLVATGNLQNVVQEFHATGGPPEGFGSLAALVRYDFAYFATHFVNNLFHHLAQDIDQVLGWAMTILVGAGLLSALLVRPNRPRLAIIGWGLVYAVSLGFVFYLARFSLPLVPVYALLAASLLDRLPRWTPLVAIALMVLVIVFQSSSIGVSVDFYRAEQPQHLQESIDYLKAQSIERKEPQRYRLMARKPHAAWYGNMDFVPYPGRLSGAADLLSYAAARNVDYLLVGPIENRFFERAAFLSRLSSYHGVTPVYQAAGNTIYRLDRNQSGTAFGTAENIVRLQEMWDLSLRVNDIEMIKTIGASLIEALDRDGRFEEARQIAMRKLDGSEEPDALIVRLYIAVVSLKLSDPQAGIAVLEGHLGSPHNQQLAGPTAKGYLLLGQLYVESGDNSAARDALGDAFKLYNQLGLKQEAGSVQFILDQLGK